MPAGSDFVCENEKCKEYRKGIVILNVWPLGDISKIIESKNVKIKEDFHKGLIGLREQGRTHACINYPNVDKVPVSGYRVQNWCQNCFCIWGWDIMLGEDIADPKLAAEKFPEALAKEPIPSKCPKCQDDLRDFQKIINDGITCLHCKEQMKTYTWFSNETE